MRRCDARCNSLTAHAKTMCNEGYPCFSSRSTHVARITTACLLGRWDDRSAARLVGFVEQVRALRWQAMDVRCKQSWDSGEGSASSKSPIAIGAISSLHPCDCLADLLVLPQSHLVRACGVGWMPRRMVLDLYCGCLRAMPQTPCRRRL